MEIPSGLAAPECPVQHRVELLLGEVVPVAMPRRPVCSRAAGSPVRGARVGRRERLRGPRPEGRALTGREGGRQPGVDGQRKAGERAGGQWGRLAHKSGDPAEGEGRQRRRGGNQPAQGFQGLEEVGGRLEVMGGWEERGVVGGEAGGAHAERVSAVSRDRLASQGQSHIGKSQAGKQGGRRLGAAGAGSLCGAGRRHGSCPSPSGRAAGPARPPAAISARGAGRRGWARAVPTALGSHGPGCGRGCCPDRHGYPGAEPRLLTERPDRPSPRWGRVGEGGGDGWSGLPDPPSPPPALPSAPPSPGPAAGSWLLRLPGAGGRGAERCSPRTACCRRGGLRVAPTQCLRGSQGCGLNMERQKTPLKLQ